MNSMEWKKLQSDVTYLFYCLLSYHNIVYVAKVNVYAGEMHCSVNVKSWIYLLNGLCVILCVFKLKL